MNWETILKWDEETEREALNSAKSIVWPAMLELKKLTEKRRLAQPIEQKMLEWWMKADQGLDAAKTQSEWKEAVKVLKDFMTRVLNDTFGSEEKADKWLEKKGFI